MYDQWKDTCPDCDGALVVYKMTLEATGETLRTSVDLHPDGFVVPAPDNIKNCSTSDEKVRCCDCGKTFELHELALEDA